MDRSEYFRRHPPHCLAGFMALPAELPGVSFDGHVSASQFDNKGESGPTIEGPENIDVIFALSCHCGGKSHFVHGFRWTNPDSPRMPVFLSPLALECADCGKKTDVFDSDIHGFEAALGYGTATIRAAGTRAVFECSRCGRQPLRVYVNLEYSDDLFDEDHPEFAGRQPQLFSWICLVGFCRRCASLLAISDFECA